MPTERRARAMGSDAVVVVVGGPSGLADAAIERLGDLERRWSRFLPDSDVSRANRAAGEWTRVSPETLALVERAELARRRTGGRFDATRLRELEHAGYDRTFELLVGTLPLADTHAEVEQRARGLEVHHETGSSTGFALSRNQ